jgi:serine/threonine protein kinase
MGLRYLHSCYVIHGSLKGVRGRSYFTFTAILMPGQSSILVDAAGHARITDFGFVTVAQNPDSARCTQPQRGHTVRWAAPEILNEGPHSKEADIFSFAMVMIEVLRHG